MGNLSSEYKGYIEISDTDPNLHLLYEDINNNVYNLLENQYLIIKASDGKIIAKYKWQDGTHKDIVKSYIETSYFNKVKAKNIEQKLAFDALLDETTTVKLITGCFGSGKSFLSCVYMSYALNNLPFQKIVYVRNNIEVKDSNPIGHLKGTYYDKMSVWAMPLADHLGGKEELDKLVENGKVEVEHLGFIRGRDFRNSIIYCTEAEHLTREHVQLLISRVGEGSILILEGDCKQIDKSAFEKDNGLIAAIEALKGQRLFSYVHLRESVRSDTAKLADLLDKQ